MNRFYSYLILGLIFYVTQVSWASDLVPTPIFDWQTYTDVGNAVIPSPRLDSPTTFDWRTVFDSQHASSKPLSIILRNGAGPVHGNYPGTLAEVLAYVDQQGYKIDYVFADFEAGGSRTRADAEEDAIEMARLVKQHSNPNINSAYVGNYGEFASATRLNDVWGNFDNQPRSSFYLTSDLDISMPATYSVGAHINISTREDRLGTLDKSTCMITNNVGQFLDDNCLLLYQNEQGVFDNISPSARHGGFWAQLESVSAAKRNLPVGHLLLPWVGGHILQQHYPLPIPHKEEHYAFIHHMRLRGADGYYTWSHADSPHWPSREAFRDDILANAWQNPMLENFFTYPGPSEVLNDSTNKLGAIEWSGMRRGNHVLVAVANYTDSDQSIALPSHIENLPTNTPTVPGFLAAKPGGGFYGPDESGFALFAYEVGPLSYWNFDDNVTAGAPFAIDQQEAGNDSVIEVAEQSSNGLVDKAAQFNGVDSGIDFGDVLDLGLGDRTVSLWFKADGVGVNDRILLCKCYSSTGSQYSVYLHPSGHVLGLMNINGYRIVSSDGPLNDGQWHNVVLTIDRDDKMTLYIDGVKNDDLDISSDQQLDVDQSVSFYLGRSNKASQQFQRFEGLIDDVKVYSGVLSDFEIADAYQSISGGQP